MDTSTEYLSIVASKDKKVVTNFICIFCDERENHGKVNKFHLNFPGDTTVSKLYEEVAIKSNYKYNTFLLAVVLNEKEKLIDYYCDDSLADILTDTKEKRIFFKIKQKNVKDPVASNDDEVSSIQQDTEDTISYAGAFFQQQEETIEQGGKSYAIPSNYSYSPYSLSMSVQSQRSSTGYVGLVNQAMTCYLNSLLQTLFMTPEFRNALYRWRYKQNESDASKSIPYQLQKLFLKLETSKKRAVETTDLTKSFGWDSSEAWQQHDVQELCRVMFDALDETLKNTDQSDLINKLYQGKMKDYVKCLNCGHENSRFDNYLDISVDIRPFGSEKPYSSLSEALQAFVTPETLDGNNQYFCEKCNSKQNAHKGLKFMNFPYLLTIQLKRFTFDFHTVQRMKLHDRLTFPFIIDLEEYLEEKSMAADTIVTNVETEEKQSIAQSTDEKTPHPEQNEKCKHSNNRYELFSVLIHSGSALGGHYYAYIKSFEDNLWYSFNDQCVTEASVADIEKSFGGVDKCHSTGYYSNDYSSSTNAYMLMYRKIDKSMNKDFIKQSEWSQSLTQLCNYFLKDEEDEYTKQERLKDICKVNLLCFHPKTGEKMKSKLEVHKDTSMKEATEIAWKVLNLDHVIPLGQCRLVKYDDYSGSFIRSYEEEQHTPMSDLVGGVRITYGFDLLLECREKDQLFHVYEPNGTTLKVYLIDFEEEDIDEPRTIHVPLTHTVADLKNRLEEVTGLSPATMRVAVWKEYHDFIVLDNAKRTLKQEGFYKFAKIFVEGLSEDDKSVEFKKSKFYERLDIFHNTIQLKIILPFIDDITHNNKEMLLNIDKRTTLQNLKLKIQQLIAIDADMFRVYRLYSNNQEYECTRPNEQLIAYTNDNKIIVKLGRALKARESRLKLYQLDVKQDEHTKLLMETITYPNLSVKELKEKQILPELRRQKRDVSLERVRIRKKLQKSPGRIYADNNKFGNEINMFSTELFVELLDEKEVAINEDYLSIYVRRWCPATVTLEPFDEVILYKDTTVKNLKQQIEKKSGIPAERIHIAKGHGLFPCSVSILDIHHELCWDPVATKLNDYPLSITDDGSVIYYRDSREVLKALSDDERREIRNKENGRNNNKSSFKSHLKEKALKIYTNGTPS